MGKCYELKCPQFGPSSSILAFFLQAFGHCLFVFINAHGQSKERNMFKTLIGHSNGKVFRSLTLGHFLRGSMGAGCVIHQHQVVLGVGMLGQPDLLSPGLKNNKWESVNERQVIK